LYRLETCCFDLKIKNSGINLASTFLAFGGSPLDLKSGSVGGAKTGVVGDLIPLFGGFLLKVDTTIRLFLLKKRIGNCPGLRGLQAMTAAWMDVPAPTLRLSMQTAAAWTRAAW